MFYSTGQEGDLCESITWKSAPAWRNHWHRRTSESLHYLFRCAAGHCLVGGEGVSGEVFCRDMCGERARLEKFFSVEASKMVVKKHALMLWRYYGKRYYRCKHVTGWVYE